MKPSYVTDLTPDTAITSFFLVCEKELRSTREGKSFLRLELGDRSGCIEARVWEGAEQLAGTFDRDDIVKVQARVESYRSKVQLAVDKVRRALAGEIDLADYFPHTKEDVEKLYLRLREHAAAVRNPWLKCLLARVIEDPALVPRLKRAPAAKMMHHAFLGGLLEHMISLCDLCRLVAGHYPELDPDLLMTGAILHDVGKLDELCYERSFNYTVEGQLLGHIILELELVTKKMDGIEGFPPDLKTLVKHLLISHHGRYEFGSPKLPMFPEALVLHYLDDLDSKVAAARAVLASEAGENGFTAYSGALERRMLRLSEFRKAEFAVPGAGNFRRGARAGYAVRRDGSQGLMAMASPLFSGGVRHSILEMAPLELDCMNALWPLGEATVRDIQIALAPTRPRAYTTIMTILDRLAQKGVVLRRKNGRAWVYSANVSEEEARSRAIAQLVDGFFDGSPEALAKHLSSDRGVAPPQLARVRPSIVPIVRPERKPAKRDDKSSSSLDTELL